MELTTVLADAPAMPTFPFELEDERAPEYLETDIERYEYLVNHEHRPLGMTMSNRTIPLPGIALLSPLWPPYPIDVRYRAWALTDTLYSQLQSEFERQTFQP